MSSRRSFLAGLTAAGLVPGAPPPTRLQTKLSHQWQRPQYHLLPAANWMNDPCGPLHYRGVYHMFYQYNPNGAFWGTMHWGHATSRDMLRWKHQPVALAPTPGGPDFDGVFSGCAVLNKGVPTIVYTAVKPETQCLATSRDPQLNTWEKFAGNPVIPKPPEGYTPTGFRDPCVWPAEGGGWYMALGSGRKGVGGMVLLYRSPDLTQWSYIGPMFEGPADPNVKSTDTVATGEMWECPDFFPLGGKYVLLISTRRKVYWWVGRFKDQKFTPETDGTVDEGAYYAARSMLDAKNRRILWGWITEKRPVEEHKAAGWAGAMSLPRVLTIGRDNRLIMEPLPEIASLHDDPTPLAPVALKAEQLHPLKVYGVESAEFIVEFAPTKSEVGLQFSPTRNPFEVAYDPGKQEMRIGNIKGKCPLAPNEPIRFHLFRDGSVLELFVNNRFTLTGREYMPGMDTVSLFARNGPARATTLKYWPINAISDDRLST